MEVHECDRCGAEGTIYVLTFDEGTKEFVLCDKHNKTFEQLRATDYGVWRTTATRPRSGIVKVDMDQLLEQFPQ